ncbi:ComG operon protein 2 [Liquorilactobacillus oeni DSM 19972]|uniref:ComG operon protein 2 n=1 Tax=Liquorilactobacillus oeni DSM 19972 TaxID=1423777 RepID=A0A0R1M7S4_9LACO|nr:ComG operon protein 2 [Liquorilactobacillus oeni DSM 19972]
MSSIWKGNTHRWRLRQQLVFFKTLADLLKSGFSLQQAVVDIKILLPQQRKICELIEHSLKNGEGFCFSLKKLIDNETFNQLYIAEKYGVLYESIKQLGDFWEKKEHQKQRLQAVLLYPVFLLILITILIFAFQLFLKPEIGSFQAEQAVKDASLIDINTSLLLPFFICLILLMLWIFQIYLRYRNKKYLQRKEWLCTLPFFGKLYRLYLYYYISFNLALLLKSGLDLNKICTFLVEFEPDTLLFHVGTELKHTLMAGQGMKYFIGKHNFIPQEFILFLSKGSTLNELSAELMFYSQTIYKRLLVQMDRLIELVQPLLFLVVALLIISSYLSMLLPLYHNLGGMYK